MSDVQCPYRFDVIDDDSCNHLLAIFDITFGEIHGGKAIDIWEEWISGKEEIDGSEIQIFRVQLEKVTDLIRNGDGENSAPGFSSVERFYFSGNADIACGKLRCLLKLE